jgi:peptidoglycan/LPS O-acetylase OafA/YrhL
MGAFRLGYLPSLDGLRGVAILLVMLHHSGRAPGGFVGVDIFFVLSGFLITALLMQERAQNRSLSLGDFYARRALRLFPALFLLLALFLAVPRAFGMPEEHRWDRVLPILLYYANWALAFQWVQLGVLSPTWSLAMEEQFYLLWPPILVLLLVLGARRSLIVGVVLLGIAVAPIERAAMWHVRGPDVWARLYWGLDTRMDALLLGCLVGLLAAWGKLPTGRLLRLTNGAALPALAALFILADVAPPPTSAALHNGVGLFVCTATAVLITALITSPPKIVLAIFEVPALVWVGRLSYGLYLWHVPIFHGVLNESRMARMGITGLSLDLVRWIVTFGVAAASFYLVERRILELKGWFRHRAHAGAKRAVVASSSSSGSIGPAPAETAELQCVVIVSRNARERTRHLAQQLAWNRNAHVIVDRRAAESRNGGSVVGGIRRDDDRRLRPEIDAEIRSVGYAILPRAKPS